jgi:hypothetical protein
VEREAEVASSGIALLAVVGITEVVPRVSKTAAQYRVTNRYNTVLLRDHDN